MYTSGRDQKLFSIEDITAMSSVSGISLSPDGNQLVCIVTTIVEDNYREEITLIDLPSNTQKKIVEGNSPQWSPAGRFIAYMGQENGTAKIYLYDFLNEEITPLINVYTTDYFIDHYTLHNFCWSPDGCSIAYVSAALSSQDSAGANVRVITDLLYKTKGGRERQRYAGEGGSQIWLLNIADKTTRRVFDSDFHEHSISFSPDGKEICFVSNRSGKAGLNQWSDIYTVNLNTEKIKRISSEKGSAFQPAWSPDGKFIAYLGITSEINTNDSPAEDTQLYIVPSSGGAAECITPKFDRRIEQISWHESSTCIYFIAEDRGNTNLYCTKHGTKEIEIVIADKGRLLEYSVNNNGKTIAYCFTNSTHKAEVFLYDLVIKSKKTLTNFSKVLSASRIIQPPETFIFKSFDHLMVQGWIIRPANFDENKKYPLVLVIHGGPHNMFGDEFEERMQLLSAHGYGVLFINPRGSSGYGQEFSNGTLDAWGEGDYEDLMKGVDHVIEQHQWIDALRLGVTGQSYGGYMTNRIITKTNRFKAAVADGSISNLISFAGTSLYHSLMVSEFQQSVYTNFDRLWHCSPLKNVKQVTTPVLFLHGETDNEVPVSQAEEMYIALKRLGVETSLVIYLGEGHGWRPDLRPSNKIDVLKRIINWFDRYLF